MPSCVSCCHHAVMCVMSCHHAVMCVMSCYHAVMFVMSRHHAVMCVTSGSSAQPTALYNGAAMLGVTLNTLLHEHAKKIWTNIEQMHPQLYLHLTFPQETRQIPHRAFLSSKTKILGPSPTPKYT
ncbi:hypothetical protein FHG87_024905 [Trinorchestia longiramus]|nr:hypothetical protein FHG87_024905 [Trinorchestia longiramus]